MPWLGSALAGADAMHTTPAILKRERRASKIDFISALILGIHSCLFTRLPPRVQGGKLFPWIAENDCL
jgi:hypothetical protein